MINILYKKLNIIFLDNNLLIYFLQYKSIFYFKNE